jgi:DNA repair exonuclease SbcCD nuclease subunit
MLSREVVMTGQREVDGDAGGRAGGHDLVLVHSSDLHLGTDGRGDDLRPLRVVLTAARAAAADVLLLAGDVFDHNRLPLAVIDAAARLLADAGLLVVILPGNHDCLAPGSVYRRGGLADPANVHVLGITAAEAVELPALDLEIWGRPHLDHVDMSPLRDGRPRGRMRWNVATAHGHWVSGPQDYHRSWLIHQEELHALDTDYVALGHWDRAAPVGDGRVHAYYSGSPDIARSVNVVRFTAAGAVRVERVPLDRT